MGLNFIITEKYWKDGDTYKAYLKLEYLTFSAEYELSSGIHLRGSGMVRDQFQKMRNEILAKMTESGEYAVRIWVNTGMVMEPKDIYKYTRFGRPIGF